MVGLSSTTALAVLIGLQQAAATGGGRGGWGGGSWTGAPSYSCPGSGKTPPTVCTPQQASGWDWSGLSGGSFDNYDSSSFSCGKGGRWSYSKAGIFGRDTEFAGLGLEARTGGGRGGCASASLSSHPGFSNQGEGRNFGDASFYIATTEDADIEVEYTQRGGGKCSQYVSCSKQGTSFKNTQCGDCTGVTFKPRGGGKGSGCGFGLSSVSYACSSTTTFSIPQTTPATTMETTTTPVSPPSTDVTTTASSISSTSTDIPSTSTGAVTPPTTTATVPETTSTDVPSTSTGAVTPPSTTATVPETTTIETISVPTTSTDVVTSVTTSFSMSTVVTTTDVTVTSCGSTVTDCPADSTVVTTSVVTSFTSVPVTVPTTVTSVSTETQASVTTLYTTVSTTICPVTETQTVGNSTIVSTYLSTSLVPVTYTTTAPVQTITGTVSTSVGPVVPSSLVTVGTSSSAAPAVPSAPASGGGCPGSVPSCLNTWLDMLPECKDNTDASCFCVSSNFTSTIIDCLEAYSGADLSDAISYFQGICAPHAGENPQPFTGIPSTITVTAPATSVYSVPMTTITITGETSTATVTVPAVSFSSTTASAGETGVPALVPAGGNSPSTIPIVGGGSGVPTTAVSPPPAVGTVVGTGSLTIGVPPTATSPISIATGAASRDFVSAGAAFGAIFAAVLAL